MLSTQFLESTFIPSNIYDNFYEIYSDFSSNDLVGIYVTLYITNSILLVIIALLLLIASIICVFLVSFFVKNRNFFFKDFLINYKVIKHIYNFIFLRKQNLGKQGRSAAATRIFLKKTYNKQIHLEYKIKHDVFIKQNQK
jgi:hypothetical protein